jgi:dUTP pyrophosphatase
MASEETAQKSQPAVTTPDHAPALLIKKLSDKAKLPTRGSAFAAGYDIYAARDTVIPGRGKALVDTDISMAVPAGTCAFIPPDYLPPTTTVVSPILDLKKRKGKEMTD